MDCECKIHTGFQRLDIKGNVSISFISFILMTFGNDNILDTN